MQKPKLIVHTGGMFSGKTTALQQECERYIRAKKNVVMVKPNIDDRYSENEIVSHNGKTVKCINSPTNMISCEVGKFDVILIDEVQFFEPTIKNDINALLRNGKIVIVDGLDMDFQKEPFETTMVLMGIADEVIKHKAVCEFCGEDANLSLRTVESKEKILLGQVDSYKATCRNCFERENKGEKCND